MTETMEYTGTELEAMELARNYHRWIVDFFRPYIRGTVVEIGAGIGTVSELLAECSPSQLRCFEPATNLFPSLERRMRGRENVRVENSFYNGVLHADAVVLINVLEHIEDDGAMLQTIRGSLIEGGRMLLFVPAVPWIRGTLDEQFGHLRRYTKRQLSELVTASGYTIELLRYVNCPGVFAWFFTAKILRKPTISPRAAAFYDSRVIPLVRALEDRIAPPIGQSLILIAKKH
ncbi:MAG TPA: methyltransferase domain-containing protein [Candidatus Acidoferrales bacterium]|nr:methyltransferase domain-containing protein [Candidatus Acidoferrales bacterium]